ncbi:MAG: diguanylate cyclase [Burkholderiales bacterium]
MVSRGSAWFVTRLWWTVGLLLAFFSFFVGHSIYTSWRQHEEQAVVETYSVARVLESDLAGLFDKVKLALHTVATERERELSRERNGDDRLRAYAANIDSLLPDVEGFLVSDEHGRIVVSRAFLAEPVGSVADAPYFAKLRDLHVSGVVVSAPHHAHFGSQEEIDVVRRVEHPDGRFAGVVVAPVLVERLVRMLAAADAGSLGAVSLRGENLELIARYPPREGSPAPDELRSLVEAGEISGTFRSVSRTDGVERMYSYRRVANYPLHITVGRATSEYLGHFRRDMGMVALLATGLLAVAILATAMVDRAWRRQARVAKLLEMQAHTDSLTGLANRRRFFEMAEAELARARRYDAPLSMLMLDIDHFKEVNDTHGHRAGDRVLQSLARTCLGVLRNVDVVGRVGGEEFAILLPETGLEGARDVAERLREAVERSAVARDEGVPLRITVSVGVAVLSEGVNLDTLLSQSDAALYDAKHRGRNRVCAFGEAA